MCRGKIVDELDGPPHRKPNATRLDKVEEDRISPSSTRKVPTIIPKVMFTCTCLEFLASRQNWGLTKVRTSTKSVMHQLSAHAFLESSYCQFWGVEESPLARYFHATTQSELGTRSRFVYRPERLCCTYCSPTLILLVIQCISREKHVIISQCKERLLRSVGSNHAILSVTGVPV